MNASEEDKEDIERGRKREARKNPRRSTVPRRAHIAFFMRFTLHFCYVFEME